MTDYLIGIDGGGTKTVCVVADEKSQILGKARSGPANYLKEGLYTAKSSLREAILGALQEASVDKRDAQALCAGLAGMDRPHDREIMTRIFNEIVPVPHLALENDAFIALVGATEGKPGVIVISGSGSIALGVNRRGEKVRSGGWGHVLGDEGSGYDLTRRGLKAALQDYDGRGQPTSIGEKILRELYLKRMDELIPLLYGEGMGPSKIAALYPVVLEAAEEGDQVACSLIERAAQDLADAAIAVIRKLGLENEPFPVAVSGGVFQRSQKIRERFEYFLKRAIISAELIRPKHRPEIGALLVARAQLEGKQLFGQ